MGKKGQKRLALAIAHPSKTGTIGTPALVIAPTRVKAGSGTQRVNCFAILSSMDDMQLQLRSFAREYSTRQIPPPHILLVGSDRGRSELIAAEFAQNLGTKYLSKDAGNFNVISDLTEVLLAPCVVFLSNIQLLKRAFAEKLSRDISVGMWEVVIGQGPAARHHKMELDKLILIASCPTKYACPPSMLKIFEAVFSVAPFTDSDLVSVLEKEAWKDRISLDPDASALLVRCCNRDSDLLLSQFRRICGVIEQIKRTNKPQLTRQEVADALDRLRIKVPPLIKEGSAFNLHSLSGQDFEVVIQSLLREMGFDAELTQVTGDGGIDIIARLDRPFVSGRYVFQCKRYAESNLVGAPEVRDFYGAVMADRAMKGVFITTSDFTGQAKEFAEQSGIELVNLPKLLQLFEDHGLTRNV